MLRSTEIVSASCCAASSDRFVALHPRSAALAAEAAAHLVAGVPMPWMTRWPGAFPIHVAEASGARFVDVDGIEYVDFCLGDTGAMSGHGGPRGRRRDRPPGDDRADDDAADRRTPPGSAPSWPAGSGCPKWQMAMTATDANRFVLRFARHLTGRPKVAVMDWCYHGTVDETLAILERPTARSSAVPGRSGRRSTRR